MSTINFPCYACNQVLKVGTDKAGRKAKCIKCGTILTIPMASSEELVEATRPFPAKSPQAVKSTPPPPVMDDEDDRPRKRRRDEDEDEDDRPRRRRDEDEEDEDRPRKRRRDEDDDDDQPRKRGRDDDDDDDRGRSRGRGRDDDEEDLDDEPVKKVSGNAQRVKGGLISMWLWISSFVIIGHVVIYAITDFVASQAVNRMLGGMMGMVGPSPVGRAIMVFLISAVLASPIVVFMIIGAKKWSNMKGGWGLALTAVIIATASGGLMAIGGIFGLIAVFAVSSGPFGNVVVAITWMNYVNVAASTRMPHAP